MNIQDFQIEKIDAKTEKKLLGIRGWFVKGEKRQSLLTSKIVEKAIKEKKAKGEISKEDIDKIKFAYDPIFRQKVIDKVHHDCDKEYERCINNCVRTVTALEKARTKEIKRIEESRWQNIVDKKLRYNMTEGKLLYNNTIVLFSSIKGAAVNISESYRSETKETGKSKKHASAGGAVLGGLMFGAVGAVVGGAALGKTTHNGNIYTNNIPTANHIGVIVDIDGFKSEIVLLNETVDQDSDAFRKSIEKAQTIISKLQFLSATPVPESFLKPEEEASVIELDRQIVVANKDLETARADIPTYEIPERYL